MSLYETNEPEYLDKVTCGFNKWSIGVGKNGEVIIDFSRHPNFGSISLYDTSVDDLRNLGEMFLGIARKLQQKSDE